MSSTDTSSRPSHQPALPGAIIIFGASGDLAHRKLAPALYHLSAAGLLPEGFVVLGAGRQPFSDAEFRASLREALPQFVRGELSEDRWRRFAASVYYQQLQYDQADDYRALAARLAKMCERHATCGRHLFYLAVPPDAVGGIIEQLGDAGLNESSSGEDGWARVVVEKPFGRSLATATALNRRLTQVFREEQIFRIDHYLGKETVQNLLVLRFANGIFEPIWNRQFIDHVQITVAESLGIEGRGESYDGVGALRDMVQNHLLQLLCLVAMEPPSSFRAGAIRDEKSKVLEAARQIPPGEMAAWAVRAQYAAGRDLDGVEVIAYRDEPGVRAGSATETYAAVRVMLDNWRWAGVPFYLRSGKRLSKRLTEIVIQFNAAPMHLFREVNPGPAQPNGLVLQIQPRGLISLELTVKQPGPGIALAPKELSWDFLEAEGSSSPDAYERLLLDCTRGDTSLFARADWVELAWGVLDPVLAHWDEDNGPIPTYRAGKDGPVEADRLLARDERVWRPI